MTFRDEGWGDEFVGLAIHRATDEMKWSQGKQVLRVMFIVGNETARQGPPEFDYTKTAPAAIANDIVVNAIYCGDYEHAQSTPSWRELARLADGEYMEIAGQGGAIVLASPFDDELASLNDELNKTYLAYGEFALAASRNQLAQDANAASLGVYVTADRAAAKASGAYRNARWDLVDASMDDGFELSSVKDEDLPESVRKIEPDKRMDYIKQIAGQRAEIQKTITEVASKRGEFLQEEIRKQGLSGDKAFDQAVKNTLVNEAKKKGFEFDDR